MSRLWRLSQCNMQETITYVERWLWEKLSWYSIQNYLRIGFDLHMVNGSTEMSVWIIFSIFCKEIWPISIKHGAIWVKNIFPAVVPKRCTLFEITFRNLCWAEYELSIIGRCTDNPQPLHVCTIVCVMYCMMHTTAGAICLCTVIFFTAIYKQLLSRHLHTPPK